MAGVEQGPDGRERTDPHRDEKAVIKEIIEKALAFTDNKPSDAHILLAHVLAVACQIFAKEGAEHMRALFEATIGILRTTRDSLCKGPSSGKMATDDGKGN